MADDSEGRGEAGQPQALDTVRAHTQQRGRERPGKVPMGWSPSRDDLRVCLASRYIAGEEINGGGIVLGQRRWQLHVGASKS
jgi:hypothetical protein